METISQVQEERGSPVHEFMNCLLIDFISHPEPISLGLGYIECPEASPLHTISVPTNSVHCAVNVLILTLTLNL